MTLFFLVFLVLGLAATAALVVETLHESEVWFWPEVACRIIDSGVELTGDDSNPYQPTISYSYEIDGRSYTGHTLTRADTATSSYDAARRPSDHYPANALASCRVDPENPSIAVLERRFPWIALVTLLPLIFVAIGLGGLVVVWRSSSRSGDGIQSISQRARGAAGLGWKIELGMGLVFTVVGGALSVFLLVLPVSKLVAAASWTPVPAVIDSSTVRSWSTDDGTTHRADILYRYSAGGREWLSNRLTFFPAGSSSDAAGARELVASHPPGSATTCFVDPDDPGLSVLDRGVRPVYLIGLFPLAFLLAGLALAVHSRTAARTAKRPDPSSAPEPAPIDESVETTLEPTAGPWAKVLGMLLFAAIWNGIVSVFVWQVVAGFGRGSPDWFLTVFMIPFVLVGLAAVGGVAYTLLAAFNPRPRVVVSPAAPRLGEILRLRWSWTGKVSRVDKLTITLEGYEQATYRRGTDTHTDRRVFASMSFVDTDLEWEIPQGAAEIEIPPDTMHSFTSNNNAVVWAIQIHGTIARWPDVLDSFTVEVRPMRREEVLP